MYIRTPMVVSQLRVYERWTCTCDVISDYRRLPHTSEIKKSRIKAIELHYSTFQICNSLSLTKRCRVIDGRITY